MSTLVIRASFLTRFVFVVLPLVWLAVGGMVLYFFGKDLRTDPSLFSWVKLIGGGGVLGGVAGYLFYFLACRLVLRAEMGEDLRLNTLLRSRQLPWSAVGRFVLKEQNSPVPSRFVLKLVLTDGTRLDLFAGREQAEAAYDLAQGKPVGEGWPGQALWKGNALASLGLGVVALVLGAWMDYHVLREYSSPGEKTAIVEELDQKVWALIMAVIVPLAGLAGIGFGAYHLIRRPLVVRPGVDRVREGEATRAGQPLKELFGRHE